MWEQSGWTETVKCGGEVAVCKCNAYLDLTLLLDNRCSAS